MYLKGAGVEQDYREAVKWYGKAAEQNVPAAQFGLGLLYLTGNGTEQDEAKGRKWIAKAAEQGLEEARDMLKLLDDLFPKQNGED